MYVCIEYVYACIYINTYMYDKKITNETQMFYEEIY